MPNWCQNSVHIKHSDEAAVTRLVEAYKAGRLCDEFIPIPEELRNPDTGSYGGEDADAKDALREQLTEKYGYAGWYEFCINEWGTKWDIGGADEHFLQTDTNTVILGFDSAWAPPVGLFQKLFELGYEVRAFYWEAGMCFAGIWENGNDDYYEYSNLDVNGIEELLPEDLDYEFNIVQNISEWQETG